MKAFPTTSSRVDGSQAGVTPRYAAAPMHNLGGGRAPNHRRQRWFRLGQVSTTSPTPPSPHPPTCLSHSAQRFPLGCAVLLQPTTLPRCPLLKNAQSIAGRPHARKLCRSHLELDFCCCWCCGLFHNRSALVPQSSQPNKSVGGGGGAGAFYFTSGCHAIFPRWTNPSGPPPPPGASLSK